MHDKVLKSTRHVLKGNSPLDSVDNDQSAIVKLFQTANIELYVGAVDLPWKYSIKIAFEGGVGLQLVREALDHHRVSRLVPLGGRGSLHEKRETPGHEVLIFLND
jgi:hypothetical protein